MSAQSPGGADPSAESRTRASRSDLQRILTQTDIPLFRGLSTRHLRRVARLAELRQYVGSRPIVRAGSPGNGFYIVVDGTAEARTADGVTVSLKPGDHFGELALLDGAPRSATVSSVGELTTARIGRSAFHKLLREEPVIAVGLLPGLVAIVRSLQAGMPGPETV